VSAGKTHHRTQAKAKVRAKWMADFEKSLLTMNPVFRGGVCWDTAAHLCNRGLGPVEAAYEYNSKMVPK